jgi:hypothetical protein
MRLTNTMILKANKKLSDKAMVLVMKHFLLLIVITFKVLWYIYLHINVTIDLT